MPSLNCTTTAPCRSNRTIRTELSEESEGLALFGQHLYFGTYAHKIFEICDPLTADIATINDSTARANNLAKIGFYGSGSVNSPAGSACVFDGTDTFTACSNPAAIDSLNSFTFEVWAKLNDITADRRFLDLTNRWNVSTSDGFAFKPYYNGSTFKIGVWSGSWKYSNAISPPWGDYHYFAATYNGSQIIFYCDGVYIGSTSYSGTTGPEPGALYIGAGDFYNASYRDFIAEGAFDEVRISNIARTARLASSSLPQHDLTSDLSPNRDYGIKLTISRNRMYN